MLFNFDLVFVKLANTNIN